MTVPYFVCNYVSKNSVPYNSVAYFVCNRCIKDISDFMIIGNRCSKKELDIPTYANFTSLMCCWIVLNAVLFIYLGGEGGGYLNVVIVVWA